MAKEEVIINIKANSNEANKSLEKVKQNTAEIKNEARGAVSEFNVMGVSLNGVKAAFTKLKGVSKLMFSSIKMGIASTGIGLLVLAVGALVTYFTKTKKGAEMLSVAFKAVGATISVLTDRISKIGGAIVKVFKGDFKGAMNDAKGAVTGLGKEIAKETRAMIALTKASQKLKDSQRDLNVETAKRRAELESLKLIAEDTTKTEAERIVAARGAMELETTLMAKRVANAEEAVRLKAEEMAMSENMAEDLDALAQLEIDLHNIKAESTTKQIELNNKINSIEKERAARIAQERKDELDAKKAEQEAREKEIEEVEKYNEELFKAEEERVKKEKELAKKAAAEKIALDKLVAQSKINVALNGLAIIGDIFGRESEAGKAAAVASATINTYQAATNALANTPAPIPFPQIAAGLTIASGMMQVKKILDVQPENKFAGGGMVSGFGTGTSDSVSARLSKGESVINARSTGMFKPLLSAINEAGGGDSFSNSLDEGSNGATMGVVKAYVVADDITRTQDKLEKIRRTATI